MKQKNIRIEILVLTFGNSLFIWEQTAKIFSLIYLT